MDTSAISFESARPVEADARLAMEWANDATTLRASFHRDPKHWDTYWPKYRETYAKGFPAPVFALVGGQRIAFLRFAPCDHPTDLAGQTLEISINVAPLSRGLGLGQKVIAAAIDHLAAHGADAVYAEVRTDNPPSLKAFLAAGFANLGERDKVVADTGEKCRVHALTAEITAPFWRKGRVYVIAEAGSNWRMGTARRDIAMGKALIDVAKDAGADAVKFQTYRPETVYVANAGRSEYLSDAGITEDISAIFADLAMPYELIGELAAHAHARDIDFMSTGFSVDDLRAIDPFVAIHKIASYEISHPHLIDYIAATKKPLLMSTGASNVEDIAWAVERFKNAGGGPLCILQCTAKYPAPMDAMNLRTIPTLHRHFGAASGLSDHSRTATTAAAAAVALGARVIEKHFTLDNRLPGPDHAFAVTPAELTQMITEIRLTEASLGNGIKRVLDAEKELAAYARRGLQATRDIAAGEALREGENFAVLRPGQQKLGAHPRHLPQIEGRKSARAIKSGDGITLADV